MNTAAMTLFQLRFINKAFWRNPASAFFTFAFPLMFLVIFTALLGSGEVRLGGRMIHQSTYYVAAMAAFAVITACYNNIAIGLCFQRDAGVLKRTRGTPLPSVVFFSAKVAHALLISLLLVAITVTFGTVLYSAEIPTGTPLFHFLVILIVGAASFCALGFAITTSIPIADSASPLFIRTILPLLFLSAISIPISDNPPSCITWTARFFPVSHFAAGIQAR